MPGVSAEVVQGLVQGDRNTVNMTFDQRGATITQANLPPVVNPAKTPLRLVPPGFDELLDRTESRATLIQAIGSRTVSELSGPGGIGKTALLRYLCSQLDLSPYRTGVVYVEQRGQSADDLLQFLFGAFYDSPPGFIPVGGALFRYLQSPQALVIVDGLTLDRPGIEHLRTMAGSCTFLLAGDRVDLAEGRAVALAGLPEDAARALVERRLGRPLAPAELSAAHDIWTHVAGNPLLLIQCACLVGQGRLTMVDLAARIATSGPEAVAAAAVAASTPDEKRTLSVLSALGDESVPAQALESMVGQPAATESLDALAARGLIQPHSPTFTAPANIKAALGKPEPATAYSSVLEWSARVPSGPELLEAAPMVQHAIDVAASVNAWKEVLELARRLDPVLGPSGRWGAWKAILERALEAARNLKNRSEEGWALHQLGSRSLVLEQFGEARELLEAALQARRAARDSRGIAATQHNLGQLKILEAAGKASLGLRGNGSGPKGGGSPPWGLIAGATVALVLVASGGAAYAVSTGVVTLPAQTSPSSATPAPTKPTPPTSFRVLVVPALNKLAPSPLAQGVNTRLTLFGSGFQEGMTVDLGPGISVRGVAVASANSAVVTISIAPNAKPGQRNVTVINRDGGEGTCFNCMTVDPAPTITPPKQPTTVYPNAAAPTLVQIYGTNFQSATVVFFPGGYIKVTSQTLVSSSEIDIQVTAANNAPQGTNQTLIASNPDGGQAKCDNCVMVGFVIQ